MNDTPDVVKTPNFYSIYESSTITTTDEGTKAGKIIRGYVEETLKEVRREYRFRDESERKLRRLQDRLKYDFLHTHMPFVRAMAFFMAYVDEERIIIRDDPFWTTDGYLEQIPDDIIRRQFGKSDLILFLGAFNFRRLNRDRYWKAEKNPQFADIIPFSLRHLNSFVPRLIKAETLVGVSRERAMQLDQENPKWNQTGGHGAFMLFEKDA